MLSAFAAFFSNSPIDPINLSPICSDSDANDFINIKIPNDNAPAIIAATAVKPPANLIASFSEFIINPDKPSNKGATLAESCATPNSPGDTFFANVIPAE